MRIQGLGCVLRLRTIFRAGLFTAQQGAFSLTILGSQASCEDNASEYIRAYMAPIRCQKLLPAARACVVRHRPHRTDPCDTTENKQARVGFGMALRSLVKSDGQLHKAVATAAT